MILTTRIEQIKQDKLNKLIEKELKSKYGLSPFEQCQKNILTKAIAIEWAQNLIREGLDR